MWLWFTHHLGLMHPSDPPCGLHFLREPHMIFLPLGWISCWKYALFQVIISMKHVKYQIAHQRTGVLESMLQIFSFSNLRMMVFWRTNMSNDSGYWYLDPQRTHEAAHSNSTFVFRCFSSLCLLGRRQVVSNNDWPPGSLPMSDWELGDVMEPHLCLSTLLGQCPS